MVVVPPAATLAGAQSGLKAAQDSQSASVAADQVALANAQKSAQSAAAQASQSAATNAITVQNAQKNVASVQDQVAKTHPPPREGAADYIGAYVERGHDRSRFSPATSGSS